MLAPFRSRGATPYLLGLLCVAIAAAVRYQFHPFLDDHACFSFFFLGVAVAAWTGGIRPALVITLISALMGNYMFTEPHGSLAISGPPELVTGLVFITVSMGIAFLTEVTARALESAKAAEQAKDEFMATVAHELRSPLSVIHYANALNRGAGDEHARDQVELIDRQVYHLNLLIEDLLDLSRVAHGKIRLNRKPVEAAKLVASVVERLGPMIASRKHHLVVNVPETPLTLDADPVRLEQVLSNLLTNAAKYTPDGGEIRVSVTAHERHALIAVRDNGMGIAEEMLPHVFEMFAQSDGAVKRSDGGLGIGLSLVRNLVELHGGTVSVSSAGPGRGSEFLVLLPLEQPAEEPVLVEA